MAIANMGRGIIITPFVGTVNPVLYDLAKEH
jgi:hypothetical protein